MSTNRVSMPADAPDGSSRPIVESKAYPTKDSATQPQSFDETTSSTLELLVNLIIGIPHCLEAAAFKFKRVSGEPTAMGRFACAPQSEPSPALVAAFFTERQSQLASTDCFGIGPVEVGGRAAYLMGLRFCDRGEVFAGGYALFDSEPHAHRRLAIHNICVLGAKLLGAFRKSRTRHEAELRGQAFQARMTDGLRLGADAYWEADSGCVIRRVILLRELADFDVLAKLDGKDLRTIQGGPEALSKNEFRDLKLEVRGAKALFSVLALSGRSMTDGSWQGVARVSGATRAAPSTIPQARSLVEQLEAARDHETALRRETELLLDGLRILTGESHSREVFQQLLGLLAPALEFDDSVILQRDWSNQISASASTAKHLLGIDWSGAAEQLFAVKDIAAILRLPEDLLLPSSTEVDNSYRSALVVKLKGGVKATLLLCLHRRPSFFGERHLGLSTRLSLIASQALMNEEERQKVVDASKLATIGELAAGIVHEINQPLTVMTLAVNNLAEMLASGMPLDAEKLGTKASRLKGQIDRVCKIVANMKVLARHSDGKFEPFTIDAVVREAAGIIEHKLVQGGIELQIDFDPNLQAYGNSMEFGQVILNLLSNAHDAIASKENGGKPKQIIVGAKMLDATWLDVWVRDTGCGFPTHDADRAFEPFFTTKGPGKGTGLGLALCRRIVENMGGTITLGNWADGAEVRLRLKRVSS